jgi:hypothetical protein
MEAIKYVRKSVDDAMEVIAVMREQIEGSKRMDKSLIMRKLATAYCARQY